MVPRRTRHQSHKVSYDKLSQFCPHITWLLTTIRNSDYVTSLMFVAVDAHDRLCDRRDDEVSLDEIERIVI